MSVEGIKVIIQELPTLIIYIVPGYLVIWTMNFMLSKIIINDDYIIIKSIALSYVIISLNGFILNFFGLDIQSYKAQILIIISALILGYIGAKLVLSNWFEKCLRKLGVSKSIHKNFLNDVVDLEKGLWVITYLCTEQLMYKGQIRKYEEKDNSENTYIVLSNYTLLDYGGEEIINYVNDNSKRVLLNTKDISRIELYYDLDSKKIT